MKCSLVVTPIVLLFALVLSVSAFADDLAEATVVLERYQGDKVIDMLRIRTRK